MATWIAHMRIAEHFMKKKRSLDTNEFLVGNIGPDCGVPNENWSKFTPDTKITHWQSGDKSTIDAEEFRTIYLQSQDEKYPFYLGYYLHLLTDIEWMKLYKRKKQDPVYAEGLNSNADFIWTIKKDWYGQDHVYLQDHKESVFFTNFSKINEFPNIYFDFYPDNAFIRQVKYITDFYMQNLSIENPNREFPYLSKCEMDIFVNETIIVINDSCGIL
jgi:hypothetical protein